MPHSDRIDVQRNEEMNDVVIRSLREEIKSLQTKLKEKDEIIESFKDAILSHPI